ncbi:hypothetical protein [Amycolatopsis sp. NPDC051128]|uniref:hypothetical protein n=1 Tax=Amycolatopsis sp. NPDC051128 TaxID=3155412 RepID=UPI00343A8F08
MANQRADDKFPGRVWAPRDLWLRAGEVATARGTNRGDEIVKFLRYYVGEPDAELPTRASRQEPDAPTGSS